MYNPTKIKLENYGVRKQWIITDCDERKCFKCGEMAIAGMYCVESDKFWCKKCEDKARRENVKFPCKCMVLTAYHENYSVICQKETKKVGQNAKKH